MKLVIYAIITTALLAVVGCTADDYDGCHGTGCLVDRPAKRDRTIDNRPQFDRNGNPNFDTRGRYIGCHGIGCQVDDPDDGDQSIDDRPQYDKQGNPNFDTQGNYQGCHGIGCEVDTPDDDDST
ncbi:hypothetical protein [Mesorhizobium sp. YR577]|uniref:hypothetical protein n=1 Tax=Mesorhizobium sp. YR577 TaxID=1884373 RepID=UPI0008E221F1|nr:hypothetical protein [Mesorhizobium sp. YR577]SFU23038.1 hypothetical protein SAMN05518861_14610 [Mesorhizobium sp. YR577]